MAATLEMTEQTRLPPWLKIVLSSAMIGLAGLILLYSYLPARTYSQSLCYFSDDDGKTWYTDKVDTLPPFRHNGRDAVRAVVYSYAGGSKQFCGYLMRFSDDAKAKVAKIAGSKTADGRTLTLHGVAYDSENNYLAEVKRPLSNEPWVGIYSPQGNSVMRVKSPDGSELDSVMP